MNVQITQFRLKATDLLLVRQKLSSELWTDTVAHNNLKMFPTLNLYSAAFKIPEMSKTCILTWLLTYWLIQCWLTEGSTESNFKTENSEEARSNARELYSLQEKIETLRPQPLKKKYWERFWTSNFWEKSRLSPSGEGCSTQNCHVPPGWSTQVLESAPVLGCGGKCLHSLVPGHLEDPDWEPIACTADHSWDSCGFHNEEQS